MTTGCVVPCGVLVSDCPGVTGKCSATRPAETKKLSLVQLQAPDKSLLKVTVVVLMTVAAGPQRNKLKMNKMRCVFVKISDLV